MNWIFIDQNDFFSLENEKKDMDVFFFNLVVLFFKKIISYTRNLNLNHILLIN
jgi:hypothetical protein